ncbi:MAG: prolipoprotein diacylglyceryl transferase [Dehalococcoidales bacterium]|nr:prolipoprotein diacylglyceryl transferase [Dehalococcoidales bacterium]MDZ4230720.1 prolipoprotein diacylglyceryl transferase [Dehalococcoidales bacterium]
MITIGMDPILFVLGPFALSWHGLFIVVGIAVAVWLSAYLVAKAGLSVDRLYSLAVWTIPGGIIGARLVHVIDYWDFYSANPAAIFAIWTGGLAIWGAVLGGTLAAMIFARISHFSLDGYADSIAPGLVLAQAIGRIGDIINGEHISTSTTLPWGVVYTHPGSPSYGLPPTHPQVAYELLMNLAIFGVLWKLRGRIQPGGALFLLYLVMYSVGRFFLSFLRLDSNTVFLSLNQVQWICLLVLAVAVPLLVRKMRRETPIS